MTTHHLDQSITNAETARGNSCTEWSQKYWDNVVEYLKALRVANTITGIPK